MPGDVRVEIEVHGDLGGGHADRAVTHEEVDLATGRIAERVGHRRDRRVELVGGQGALRGGVERRHAGILPMAVVEIFPAEIAAP